MSRTDLEMPPESEKGRYVNKFDDGDNKFRILGEPAIYREYFGEDNKPVRSEKKPSEDEVKRYCKEWKFGKQVSYVRALPAWDYKAKQTVVLSLKKQALTKALRNLVHNEEFGDPTKYNITITKKWKDLETEYSLVGWQIRELDQEIKDARAKSPIDIWEMIVNWNPFVQVKEEKKSEPKDDLPF